MSLTIPNDYTPQDISHLRYCIWDIGGPLYSRGNPGLSEVVNEQFYRVIVHRTGWKRSVAKREYDKLYDETNRARESLIQLTGEDCLEECMDAVDPRPYLARDTELVQLIEDLKQYYGIKPIILTNGTRLFTERVIELVVGLNFEYMLTAEDIRRLGKIRKDQEVFQHVMEIVGDSDASAYLSIGDEPEKDLDPALELGMQVFLLNRDGTTISDLASFFPKIRIV